MCAKMKNKMMTIISIPLIAMILFSGYRLEKKMNTYRIEESTKVKTSLEMRKGRDVDFGKLKERNEDVRAWIYLPDSKIDYPVLQGEDNDFYLHRDIDKNYLYDGSIYIDSTNEFPFRDKNTVIYGHHMFSGAMFCGLEKFADKEYFDSHRIFQLTTEDGKYDIHAIAYLNEDAFSDLYLTDFDDASFTTTDFINLIKENAKVLSDEDFDETDTFVTMSTCAYNYDDARHQVIGIIKPAEMVEKETKTYEFAVNKWLLGQIGVGVLMALIAITPFTGRKRLKR